MDKTELESTDMAKQKCSVCSKSDGVLTLNNKKYCRGHYNNELKKFRDSLVISLIKSLEERSKLNPKLLSDVEKKTLSSLKETFQSKRFKTKADGVEDQLKDLSRQELLDLISKHLHKK